MERDTQPYRFEISLRLFHPTEDPAKCAIEFGLEPSHQWKAGDPRETPRGNQLDGFRRGSYWTASLDTSAHKNIESAVVQVAEWLSEHKTFLSRLANSGGSAELLIGFFLERLNTGFELEPELLAEYASLGVALSFDLYGAEDEPRTP